MAYVSTIISGAASLGVLIGLISGIFFLVLTALKWVSRVRASVYEEELRRQKRFLINGSYLVGSGSPNFLETKKEENGTESEPKTNGSNIPGKKDELNLCDGEDTEGWSERKTDLETTGKQDQNSFSTVKVREIIEKMVETIIGGPLDGTTVGQMSNHSAYLDMFTKYHNLLCRELARLGFALHLSVVRKNDFDLESEDLKQSNLKRLIKHIVSEAMALPNIKEILCAPRTSKETETDDFKHKSYEDILATAILNKVIENFQNKNYKDGETDGSNSKRNLKNRKVKNNGGDCKSDGDWSDTSRSDQLSLTIEEYIEEVTTALNCSEDERSDLSDFETTSNRRIPFPESGRTVVDAGTDDENSDIEEQSAAIDLLTSTSSWEENWLFQKKRLRSTPNAHHPVPVPMLVPNPSEGFRALVGGIDADDLSDMSDCSDLVLEDMTCKKAQESSTKFLNKNFDEEPQDDCNKNEKTEENVLDIQDQSQTKFFNKNDESLDISVSNLDNKSTKNNLNEKCDDTEEDLSSPVMPEIPSWKDQNSLVEPTKEQHELIDILLPSEKSVQISKNEADDTVKCHIAEREKEKWMNPVSWTDNPYSLKNIENKEQRKKNEYFRIGTYTGESIDFPDDSSLDEISKEETEKSRFSRDYYVNASKHPSGMSSPSLNQSSEEYDHTFTNKFTNATFLKNQDKFRVQEMQDDFNNHTTKSVRIDKNQFSLPSVKELAKQFTIQESQEFNRQTGSAQNKLQSKHTTEFDTANEILKKELEIDYSTIPVSDIINNIQQAAKASVGENHKITVASHLKQPSTRMEICRKVENNLVIEKYTENTKVPDKAEALKFNGKQVHSLTARSISKEFREGLKNSSYQKIIAKIDRISSSGESDQGEVVCNKTESSPTPSIDLKNMKKFWEEIITANSNSTKHQ